MSLIWLSFSIILSCVSCQLSLSCNENKGIVPKKLAMSVLAFIQTVLSLKTEFNSTNRCLAVRSNPFKPHWCPTSTRCCWTFKDSKHVSKCNLELEMKNSHLYKLLFYSICSKIVWLIQSNYGFWVTACGLTVCPVTVKTPCELSFFRGDKVYPYFCLVNY